MHPDSASIGATAALRSRRGCSRTRSRASTLVCPPAGDHLDADAPAAAALPRTRSRASTCGLPAG
eukprot:11181691-Lingulodinium_polyedra.AAC.1